MWVKLIKKNGIVSGIIFGILLVYLCVHKKTLLMSSSFLPQYVLIVLLGWIVKWELNIRTTIVLLGAASSMCSKQSTTSLCSSHNVILLCLKCMSFGFDMWNWSYQKYRFHVWNWNYQTWNLKSCFLSWYFEFWKPVEMSTKSVNQWLRIDGCDGKLSKQIKSKILQCTEIISDYSQTIIKEKKIGYIEWK